MAAAGPSVTVRRRSKGVSPVSPSGADITFRRRKSGEIPDDFAESALLASTLAGSGLLGEVSRRCWLGRAQGMLGSELFLVLLAMWSSGRLGQRAVSKVGRACGAALAAAFGLLVWPSQAAISRALGAVDPKAARDFLGWLFAEVLPLGPVERDDGAYHRDTQGQAWRVVDTDGRVLGLRQRGLPDGDDLPEGKRLPESLAVAGYPGRKRADIQTYRMVVQDAGSGRYLGVCCGPGNGEHHDELIWAARRAADFARALDHKLERTVLRCDGKSSGAPSAAAAINAGVHLLTRWTDYGLLNDPNIREQLRGRTWTQVRDSGSGPRRYATELGTIALEGIVDAGAGKPPASADLRVVVSRYRLKGDEARGCGVTIDGWRYELYGTTVQAEHWPAAELVELYYGRASQENRFGQLDAELHKLRLVTWNLPGLELFVGAGLFLSNWRLLQGAAAVWHHVAPPDPTPRAVEVLPPDPTLLGSPAQVPEPTDDASAAQASAASTAVNPAPDTADGMSTAEVGTASTLADPMATAGSPPADLSHVEVPRGEVIGATETTTASTVMPTIAVAWPNQDSSRLSERSRSKMAMLLAVLVLYLDEILKAHPGWSWSTERGALLCPDSQPARPITTFERSGKDALRLRVEPAACRTCRQRSGCTRSPHPDYARHLTVVLPAPTAGGPGPSPVTFFDPDAATASAKRVLLPNQPPPAKQNPPSQLRRSQAAKRWSPPGPDCPGPQQAAAPTLVPAYLRRHTASLLADCRVSVESLQPGLAPTLRHPPWHAATPEARQHRRRTYEQRFAQRHRLPARLCVSIPAGPTRAEIQRALSSQLLLQHPEATGESG